MKRNLCEGIIYISAIWDSRVTAAHFLRQKSWVRKNFIFKFSFWLILRIFCDIAAEVKRLVVHSYKSLCDFTPPLHFKRKSHFSCRPSFQPIRDKLLEILSPDWPRVGSSKSGRTDGTTDGRRIQFGVSFVHNQLKHNLSLYLWLFSTVCVFKWVLQYKGPVSMALIPKPTSEQQSEDSYLKY